MEENILREQRNSSNRILIRNIFFETTGTEETEETTAKLGYQNFSALSVVFVVSALSTLSTKKSEPPEREAPKRLVTIVYFSYLVLFASSVHETHPHLQSSHLLDLYTLLLMTKPA